jgi:hypothetical protein
VANADDSTVSKPQEGLNKSLRTVITSPEAKPPTVAQRVEQSPVAAFAPWVTYWVVANSPSTWLYGALAAALTAIILAAPAMRARRLKLLDAVTIVFFVGLTIAGMVAGAKDRDWMDTYSTVVSSGVLAVMALGSLAFIPFTEQYARESVPPEVWNQPAFKRTNRVLTLMWGLVFAAIAVLGYVAVKAPSTDDYTNWVIPIVLLALAVRVTQLYPARVKARAQQAN